MRHKNYHQGTLLNHGLGLYDHDVDLSQLKDKTIVDIGFHPDAEEGGLSIDYRDGDVIRRIVFGYTELGTWIKWHGVLGKPNSKDEFVKKLGKAIEYLDDVTEIKEEPLMKKFLLRSDEKEILELHLSEIKQFFCEYHVSRWNSKTSIKDRVSLLFDVYARNCSHG